MTNHFLSCFKIPTAATKKELLSKGTFYDQKAEEALPSQLGKHTPSRGVGNQTYQYSELGIHC